MGRKRKEQPILRNIEISGVAAEGKALAKVAWKEDDENKIVVFIPFGAPGDIADIKIDRKKHSYAEGHIENMITPSPIRVSPKCAHFTICGGCKLQLLQY